MRFLAKISHGCDLYFIEVVSSVIFTLSECASVYFVYTVHCFEIIFYKTLRIHTNTNIVMFYSFVTFLYIALFFKSPIHLKLPFIPLSVIFPYS
jgi:hypothetical protein